MKNNLYLQHHRHIITQVLLHTDVMDDKQQGQLSFIP